MLINLLWENLNCLQGKLSFPSPQCLPSVHNFNSGGRFTSLDGTYIFIVSKVRAFHFQFYILVPWPHPDFCHLQYGKAVEGLEYFITLGT